MRERKSDEKRSRAGRRRRSGGNLWEDKGWEYKH
jgi:hypothetical protein